MVNDSDAMRLGTTASDPASEGRREFAFERALFGAFGAVRFHADALVRSLSPSPDEREAAAGHLGALACRSNHNARG